MGKQVTALFICLTVLAATAVHSQYRKQPVDPSNLIPMPTNLKATEDLPDYVKLTWDKAEGAKEYTVYRAAYDKGTYYNIGISKTNSYEDKSAAPNRFYYYKVRSYDYEKYSKFTKPVRGRKKILPDAPRKFKVTTDEPAITLTWKEVPAATRYYVYRSNSAEGKYAIVSFAISPEYVDKSAQPNREYYYKIRAWNRAGFSEYTGPEMGMKVSGEN